MNPAPNNTLAEKRVLVIHPLVLRFALLNLERLLCRQPPRGGPSQDEAIVDLSLDDDCAEKITDVYGNQWTIVLCVENESIQWRLFYHGATEFRAQLSLLMRDPKGKLFGSIVYYVSSSGTEMPYFSPKTKCKICRLHLTFQICMCVTCGYFGFGMSTYYFAFFSRIFTKQMNLNLQGQQRFYSA